MPRNRLATWWFDFATRSVAEYMQLADIGIRRMIFAASDGGSGEIGIVIHCCGTAKPGVSGG